MVQFDGWRERTIRLAKLFAGVFFLWLLFLVSVYSNHTPYLWRLFDILPDSEAWIVAGDYGVTLIRAIVPGLFIGLVYRQRWLPAMLIMTALNIAVTILTVGFLFAEEPEEFLGDPYMWLVDSLISVAIQFSAAWFGAGLRLGRFGWAAARSRRRKALVGALAAGGVGFFAMPLYMDSPEYMSGIGGGRTVPMFGGIYAGASVMSVEATLGVPIERWEVTESEPVRPSEESPYVARARIEEVCEYGHCGPLEMVFVDGRLRMLEFRPHHPEPFRAYLEDREDIWAPNHEDSDGNPIDGPSPVLEPGSDPMGFEAKRRALAEGPDFRINIVRAEAAGEGQGPFIFRFVSLRHDFRGSRGYQSEPSRWVVRKSVDRETVVAELDDLIRVHESERGLGSESWARREAQQEPEDLTPFGIRMGMPLAELSAVPDLIYPKEVFRLLEVPEPDPDFPDVSVTVNADGNVCRIFGLTPLAAPESTRATFDRIWRQLDERFGSSMPPDNREDTGAATWWQGRSARLPRSFATVNLSNVRITAGAELLLGRAHDGPLEGLMIQFKSSAPEGCPVKPAAHYLPHDLRPTRE